MLDPHTFRYSKSHEWAHLDGDRVTVGLTQFAVDQLTDVIYIDLPDVGEAATAGKSFGEIESVKAVSDLYAPVSGEVMEVNKKLAGDPALVSKSPYDEGWLVKIKVAPGTTLDHLLTAQQYQEQIASEGH
jgi:glycine cleavage system H protein